MILTVAPGISLGAGGQSASGVVPISATGNLTVYLRPVGPVVVDVTKPDGMTVSDEGMIRIVKSGVVVNFAPTLPDVRKFSTDLSTAVTDFTGSASVRVGGTPSFTLTPDYLLTSVPAAQAGKAWWADSASGKWYIVNADGTAQGFRAK